MPAFDCQNCGAALEFKPGTTSLACDYCGHQQEITPSTAEPGPEGRAEIEEYDFHEALRSARRQDASELVQGGHELECTACGARTVLEGQADSCPYCDSPLVVPKEDVEAEGVIAPASVLPFKLDRDRARKAFHDWVKSLWFAPNDLYERARASRIDGVYMPYWTYDSETMTRYRGSRGEHYWETEYYTDAEGNRKSRQVRRTRWWPASGTVYVSFDDVLVCASKSLPRNLVDALEPWDLGDLRPYDPAFVSGFVAERYGIDLEEGFKLAEDRMEPSIRSAIRRDIGGDEQRISSMHVSHSDVTFKHFLLPLWISSFRYSEEVYRFTVNARSGEVAGERPYSWIKILLTVLAVVAVIAAIVYLVQASNAR